MAKIYLTTLSLFLLLPWCLNAQVKKAPIRQSNLAPCTFPGTTPTTAIPVCGSSVFTQAEVKDCDNIDINPTACAAPPPPDAPGNFPSTRSFWYKFRCYSGGLLGFLITPHNIADDYDWIIFDVTGHNPDDVFTDKSLPISINGSAFTGITGCDATGISDFNCYGNVITKNKLAKLLTGHNYLLMVTNFSNSTAGYDLSFEGGTAGITDGDFPDIDHIEAGCSEIKVVFTTDIKCSSITSPGSECTVTSGATSYPINNITSDCPLGFIAVTSLTVNMQNQLPPGNYILKIKKGTDGNTYLNVCDNPVAEGTEIPFTILQPVGSFTFPAETCTNDPAAFQSTSDPLAGNTIVSYHWDFGDATTGTGPNPSHTYSTPGLYTVKHWIVNSKGCNSDTMEHQVNILPLPTAAFGHSGTYCTGKDVTFTDASVPNAGNIVNWHWDMGDGNIFNFTNAGPFTHSYGTVGIKNVTLTVTTDKGCVAIITKPVTVNPKPVPAFTSAPVCLPHESAVFTNHSVTPDGSAMTYTWDFGDPASGINNTSSATDPTHYFSAPGPYTVTLTTTTAHGCEEVVSQVVSNIYPQAHAPFVVAPENCLNTPTSFTSNADGSGSAIVSYHWDFGDATTGTGATPSHTYTTPGLKTIKHWIVTDKNCHSDTTTHTVYINRLPVPDFTFPSLLCQTRDIPFTDASVPNDGAVDTWSWTFGDPASGANNTSAVQHPVHVFASTGLYSITLSVTTDKGCTSSAAIIKQVNIDERPKADFIKPQVCLNDTYAQFTDNSSITSGSLNTWEWDFGDPGSGAANTSPLQNPQHSYTAVGPYDVRLIVASAIGCKDTTTLPIFVNGSFPVADLALMNTGDICASDEVQIRNQSTVLPGEITRIEINWDDTGTPGIFDTDNTPSFGKIYKHKYASFQSPLTKDFTIRFRAYSGGVCMNEKLVTVTVNAMPKVEFSDIPATCLLVPPFVLTQGSEPNAIPGNWSYSGPGITDPNGTFDPAVAGIGTHTIRYMYTSLAGCIDSMKKTITVIDTASAIFAFSASPRCDGDPVTFTDHSTAPAGVVLTNTAWDFGDGSPLENHVPGSSFTHIFPGAGTYDVKMFNTSAYGCNSTVKTQKVLISPQPQPLFSFAEASVCLPDAKVNFINKSSIADGTENSFTYQWNFGDPASGPLNTSSAKTPSHIYIGTGPYTVTLRVTSGVGCIKTYTDIVDFIHPQPIAAFKSSKPSVCSSEEVLFTDITDPLDGTTTSWHWDMGDGSTPGTPTVTQAYPGAGTYIISLYTVNSHNCTSTTATQSMTVYPYPVVNAGPDRRVLEGAFVKMQPAVSGNDLTYLWTPDLYFPAGANKTLAPTAQYIKDDITYKLTVTGRGGCPSSDDVFIKVLKAPMIPNTFTPNNDNINDKWVIQFLDQYPNCKVQVFTRTGQLVFESTGYGKPWDGTMKGKPLPLDTYYYIIEPGEGRDPVTGFVTIIK